ncbi:MAG: pyridoxal kinase [Hyphomicrobiales bacterium]|nr:MAG: pyridoxal kinase [Hyphomicrobiales bacterium]
MQPTTQNPQFNPATPSSKKSVIVISSHVVRGSIGNRAAVFALETLEHPVWAVPTIILPWHPGHGQANRMLIDDTSFMQLLEDLKSGPSGYAKGNSNWLDEVGAVLTGYMASAEQAKAVAEFISFIKSKNKNVIHICDPVMGDGDKLYIDQDTAQAIKEHLVPISDAITPNLFELGWLTGKKVTTVQEALIEAQKFKNKIVLTTSIAGMMRNQIGNLLVYGDNALFAEHRIVGGPTNGAGDLTAAVFTAHLLNTKDKEITLQRTTASVFEVIANSAKQGADELLLEANTHCLKRPMAMVQIRALGQSPTLPPNIRKAPKRNKNISQKNISSSDKKA